jgi:hypothetical protein
VNKILESEYSFFVCLRTNKGLILIRYNMITNTELEFKGDLYPSKIVSFKHDVDSVYFRTIVYLKVTVIRDSLIRFVIQQKDILVMILCD